MMVPLPFTSGPLNFVMRVGCIAVYAAGAGGAVGMLPAEAAPPSVAVALFVLTAHAVELAVFWRRLALYPGAPGVAIVLALLFGSLHWFPLLEAERRRAPRA